MAKKPDYRKPPTAEEILRYREGNMSPEERYSFERRLEASDFYRDAEEGISLHSLSEINDDIKQLKSSLLRQSDFSYRFYLKAAAAIVLLIVFSFLIIEYSGFIQQKERITASEQNQQDFLSYEEESSDDTNNEKSPVTSMDDQKTESEQNPEKKETAQQPFRQNMKSGENATQTRQPENSIAEEPESPDAIVLPDACEQLSNLDLDFEEEAALNRIDSQKVVIKPSIDQQLSMGDTKAAPRLKTFAEMSPADQSEEMKIVLKKRITGKVVSAEDGEPLPGVNVMVKGVNEGTVTDMEGNFTIETENIMRPVLVVSFIGMETEEFEVSNQSYLEIALSQNVSQLSEVVVTALGYSKIENPTPVMKKAAPVEGSRDFRQFLKDNIRFPEDFDEKEVVHLQFTVTERGEIKNIEVLNSPQEEFIKEAIKVLRESSPWSPATVDGVPREELVKIKIRFKPPKD